MVVAGIVVAATLELTGLVLAAVGFRRTWVEHSQDEDFWHPLKTYVSIAARRAEKTARRILRRPGQSARLQLQGGEVAVIAGEVRLTVTWGPLPDPSDGPVFAAKVNERLNLLHSMVQDNEYALAKESRSRGEEDAKLRKALAELRTVVSEETANVAIGGLRLQVLGWTLVLLGIFVDFVASLADRVA